tara:strand:+ start:1220 stop:2005 length:786 start_codon:yes stop_codon:yes gene_type:complete
MKKVLVGSRAAKLWFDDYREPNDTDWICDERVKSSRAEEFHYHQDNPGVMWIIDTHHLGVPNPDVLYTLKLSHCFWNIHWQKTMFDVGFFQSKNAKLMPELFNLLYTGWEAIHGSKRVNLNQNSSDFFNEYVDRKYVHDDLHNAIAYYEEPLYTKINKSNSEVSVSEELFNKLSFEDKLKVCREEIYVIALERYLIPREFHMSKKVAYIAACKLILTRLTKGWFPKFIAENWIQLSKLDNHDFVGKFKNAKTNNTIRRNNG